MKTVISVVGARPNFIKLYPISKELEKFSKDVTHRVCFTGQHSDWNMSNVFFRDFNLPQPSFNLGIVGGTHAETTGKIMIEFEKLLYKTRPDLIIVYGDVNSTMACAICASKLSIKVAHIEAGLRSFDMTMPEEINRIITDSLSSFLFVSEKSGVDNLLFEGKDDSRIFFVGNIMIDTLHHFLTKIKSSKYFTTLNLSQSSYILATFHRPSNVDTIHGIRRMIGLLNSVSKYFTVVFPAHPRTRNNIKKCNLQHELKKNIILIDPIGYLDFASLILNAALVITDSGGIQEETTFLNIPCITVRNNTERPCTVKVGTNVLVGTDSNEVIKATIKVVNGDIKQGKKPDLWDGKTASRIIQVLNNSF